MQSTKLSTLIARMDRYQDVATVEEQFKVRDLDEALRTQRRLIKPPWAIKMTTLRVFEQVLVYPVPADHDYLAYLDNPLNQQQSPALNGKRNAYFVYTSLEQFYENVNNRNKLSDIWEQGNRYLGVRYNPINAASALVSSPSITNYAASGDASGLFEETVITIDDTNSIGFTVTNTSNPATITETIATPINNVQYKRNYYFRWAYFYNNVPTSIQLRFGNDSSNYLSGTVTAQFSGQAFIPNSWNLVAIDLNTATVTGTIDSSNFDYAAIIFNGLASGTYYINNAYLRTWVDLDYWYYSKFNVKTELATVPDQEFFFDASDNYDPDDALVADSEWIDVILFDAILTTLADNKNSDVILSIQNKRDKAWKQLEMRYPDMAPLIITQGYNFSSDVNYTGWGGGIGGDLGEGGNY